MIKRIITKEDTKKCQRDVMAFVVKLPGLGLGLCQISKSSISLAQFGELLLLLMEVGKE